MCQLLETIKCKDGKLFNMEFHQARFEKAQKEYLGISPKIKLNEVITIPEFAKNGLFRCRVTYSTKIDSIEFFPYQFRKTNSLKLLEDNEIDYHFKYKDREKLNQLFEKRGTCDNIIIVKNGYITDSYYANIIFFDGEKWVTPDTPLLYGTQRASLLAEGKIFECRVNPDDLWKYSVAGLINAMLCFETMPLISTKYIKF